ncbi:uncharacterized protein LOC101242320 isoform X2 [Ciona intestinalis]
MAKFFSFAAKTGRAAKARLLDADPGVNSDVKSESIVTMNGDKPQVKLEALGKILQKYEDHPVAIISVFGDFRGGKSFLLNLLCQYLMQKQPKDWIKKKDELAKVFNWRAGIKSHTTGIDIINKPFMLENDKGEEIAVFLMDTQGSFDKKMTAGECSLIFALSILISSVQIYNLPSGLIRESDLQQLGLFLQHANTTMKNKRSNASESSSLFPPLMFLVRNWQAQDYDYGSKGGMEYLEEVMKADQDENKDVRKKIKEGFPDVRCHLLPDPGNKVKKQRSCDSSQLRLTDIDDHFLEEVDDLAKCLFSEDSLVVKQLNGKSCTGEVLMGFAVGLDNMIKSGETPKVHTLMKIVQFVEFHKKIDEFESEYVATMNSKGEKYIDPKILEKFHTECFQKAMQQYKEHDVFKPHESQKQCQKLKTRLNGCYAIIQQKNNAQRVREQNKIMDKVGVAGNVYFKEMEKVADGQHLEDVNTAKAEAEIKANEVFKISTSDCNQDLVKECENKLHEAIQLKHREFERINANRLKLLIHDLSNLVDDCRMGYVTIMEEESKKEETVEYLRAVHHKTHGSCLKKFIDSEIGKGYRCKEQQLQFLEDGISECFQGYQNGILQKAREEKRQKITESTFETIGSLGGVMKVGGCELHIPHGALDENVEIKLIARTPQHQNKLLETPTLRCEPSPLRFNTPVTIKLQTHLILDEETVKQCTVSISYDGIQWKQFPTKLKFDDQFVIFQTNHFSSWKATFAGTEEVCLFTQLYQQSNAVYWNICWNNDLITKREDGLRKTVFFQDTITLRKRNDLKLFIKKCEENSTVEIRPSGSTIPADQINKQLNFKMRFEVERISSENVWFKWTLQYGENQQISSQFRFTPSSASECESGEPRNINVVVGNKLIRSAMEAKDVTIS